MRKDEVEIAVEIPKELCDRCHAAGINVEAFCKEALLDEIYRLSLKEANAKRRS
jgi:post-segregation antitoxin (ccd killing protein)